ncbi:MAG TPA: RNA polymerase sigma factor [Thermoanaerobaculia bacterium]|nr:RNA polymerase sigma factor [Thermoanaerobaculia bacterium]
MTLAPDPLADTVERACAGDAAAVEELVCAVQDRIYGLALRMLWHPEDARDATQDILVKIVTHLSSYRGESRFSSWCFAIAANHLRTVRRGRVEQMDYTFETFEAELHEPSGTDQPMRDHPEYRLAVEEVRVGCTLGMLLCLNRDLRLAYILGEILELDHNEAAEILDTTPAAYRQRLARARNAIVEFTSRVCGIVNRENACRCENRTSFAVRSGRVTLGSPVFGDVLRETAPRHDEIKAEIARLDEMRRAVALYRTHPTFAAPSDLRDVIAGFLAR